MLTIVQKPEPDVGPRRQRARSGALPMLAVASTFLLAGCAGDFGMRGDTGLMVTTRVADAALAAGNPEMALNVAEVILEKDPRDSAALTAKGDALYAMRDMAGAAQAYRAALAVDPAASAAGLGLGRALIRSDPSGAEAAFLGVTTRDPGNQAAWNDIGIARDLLGRHDEAQVAYRRALAVAPEGQDVAGNLGLSLALSGHADEAVTLLRPLAAVPDAPQIWHGNLEVARMAPDAPTPPQQEVASAATPPSTAARLPATPRPAPVPAPKQAAAPTPDHGSSDSSEPPRPPPPSAATASPAAVAESASAAPAEGIVATTETPFLFSATTGTDSPAPVAKAGNGPDGADAAPEHGQTALASSANAEPVASTTSHGAVQLAAYLSEQRAWLAWTEWRGRLGTLLDPWKPTITEVDANGHTLWLLRIEGFTDTTAAGEFCSSLLAQGWPGCWASTVHARKGRADTPHPIASAL